MGSSKGLPKGYVKLDFASISKKLPNLSKDRRFSKENEGLSYKEPRNNRADASNPAPVIAADTDSDSDWLREDPPYIPPRRFYEGH